MGKYVCWTLLLIIAAATADPRLWGEAGLPLRDGYTFSSAEQMATNDAGQTLVVWTDYSGRDGDIYAQLVDADGNSLWGDSAHVIVAADFQQRARKVVAFDDGFVIFHESGSYPDLYAVKVAADGSISWNEDDALGKRIDHNELSGVYLDNVVVVENEATLYSIFVTYYRWDFWREGYAYFAQRINAAGEKQWQPPLELISYYSSISEISSDVDPAGNMYVARRKHNLAADHDSIWVEKVDASGVSLWTSVIVQSVDASEVQVFAEQDGFKLAWISDSEASTEQRLHLQRYDGNGEAVWQTGPQLLDLAIEVNNSQIELLPSMSDGQRDGMLAIWSDNLIGEGERYFAQKILPDGTQLWQDQSVVLCSEGEVRSGIPSCFASDNAGGLIAVWSPIAWDGSPNSEPILAKRLDSAGNTIWGDPCTDPFMPPDPGYASVWSELNSPARILTGWVRGIQPRTMNIQAVNAATGEAILPEGGRVIKEGLAGTASNVRSLRLPDGRCAFFWSDSRGYGQTEYHIYYQITDTAGDLSEPENGTLLIDDGEPLSAYFEVLGDGEGGFFLAQKYLYSYDQVEIRVMRFDAEFAPLTESPGVLLASDGYHSNAGNDPLIAADGDGGIYIVYQSGEGQSLGTTARVMRLDGALSPMWPQPVELDDARYHQEMILALPDGTCLVIWDGSTIELAKISQTGSVQWTAATTEPGFLPFRTDAACDATGNIYVVWDDHRYSGLDSAAVFIQRFDLGGNSLGPANGREVMTVHYPMEYPSLAVDSDGNVFVAALHESGDIYSFDFYAQKLDSGLNRLWGDGGRELAISPELRQYSMEMTADNAGGLFAVWRNYRYGTDGIEPNESYIAGKWLDSLGEPGDGYWDVPEGAVICDVNSDQYAPMLSAGAYPGEYYCAWLDGRNTGGQLWMNYLRVDTTNTSSPAPPSVPQSFVLRQNYPNPFNSSTEIEFVVPRAAQVSLEMFDLLGRHVTTLVDGRMEAGDYRVPVDAAALPSGVYFYALKSGNFQAVRKMVLLK